MKNLTVLLFFMGFCSGISAQTINYQISFENAVHHEAEVKATFSGIKKKDLTLRMSRTSPGRYALHEFAKNVYNFRAWDNKGRALKIVRNNNHEWQILNHGGTVTIGYTLFANRGDGTYSQIDETHAHLNIPATFIYAPSLADQKITVDFKVREDFNWKIATQLPHISGTRYTAPNLRYFMDSPTEISDFSLREFMVGSNKVQFVLHHNGSEEEVATYFDKVKKVVLAQKEVYGELPDFDYGRYTFLACYIPNASGDGMEHRNSTILTNTRSLAAGGMTQNIGTVSHEFFHAWNVERIRPKSLEPFDFENANMSGALWFAEGFTSYYTNLILCRAGLISPKQYVEGLSGTFNYVWNSPARDFFNPIEMSNQAPFVDAANSVDPVNRSNTFISYYSYGSVLGLALDLSLRQLHLNLDDYMKLVWNQYGKTEVPYTIADLHQALNAYAGKEFGNTFFNTYIYKSEMPNYELLFKDVGVILAQNSGTPFFGASLSINENGTATIYDNTKRNAPAYAAGLEKGDVITGINNSIVDNGQKINEILASYKVGDELIVNFNRFGKERTTVLTLGSNPEYQTRMDPSASKAALLNRKDWLKSEH